MQEKKEIKKRLLKMRYLEHIALWQFIVFIMLLCIIWVNEVLDLPWLFFGVSKEPQSIFQGWILTAAVILSAIVTVGNTYLQQKYIINGLLTMCSFCQKIKIKQEVWKEIEDYIIDHSVAVFSHGICPECYTELLKSADKM